MSDSPTAGSPQDPSLAVRFHAAREHQKAGALQQARQAYEDILAQEPSHAGSLHMLGLILAQTGQAQQGVRSSSAEAL